MKMNSFLNHSVLLVIALFGLINCSSFLSAQNENQALESNNNKDNTFHLSKLAESSTSQQQQHEHDDELKDDVKTLDPYFELLQQRLPYKILLTPSIYNLIMRDQLRNAVDSNDLSENDQLLEADSESSDESELIGAQKRAATKSKKESPLAASDLKNIRRQQAARWDIGFGKRASGPNSLKSKMFMDALYGKRSGMKHSFGRKQQWDIQYGKK
jgi:hypothetical protein